MLGTQTQPGITYLTIVELLKQIDIYKESVNFTVGASYLEVWHSNRYVVYFTVNIEVKSYG